MTKHAHQFSDRVEIVRTYRGETAQREAEISAAKGRASYRHPKTGQLVDVVVRQSKTCFEHARFVPIHTGVRRAASRPVRRIRVRKPEETSA